MHTENFVSHKKLWLQTKGWCPIKLVPGGKQWLLINSLRPSDICVRKLNIIGPDNGLSPGRPQTIIWTNAGTLLIQTLRRNFNEILSEIRTFSFKKIYLKNVVCEMAAILPQCVDVHGDERVVRFVYGHPSRWQWVLEICISISGPFHWHGLT